MIRAWTSRQLPIIVARGLEKGLGWRSMKRMVHHQTDYLFTIIESKGFEVSPRCAVFLLQGFDFFVVVKDVKSMNCFDPPVLAIHGLGCSISL